MNFFANLLAGLSASVASTGAKATLIFIFDEPECPDELL
jgi:cyclic lactone autoinducer peptide